MTTAPAFDSPAAAPFNALLVAMRAELAALDDGDPLAIEAATTAKLVALIRVRDAGPAPRDRLQEARDLNALASARVNMMMASVERRLAALVAARGATPGLTYGRSGHSARS